jgi:hypothetical protein
MSVVTPYQNELLERDLQPTDSAWGFFNCGDLVYLSTESLRGVRGLGSLNGKVCKTDAQVLAETHQQLAFTMYVRQAAAKVLSRPGRTLQPAMDGKTAVLLINPPITPDETPPWSPLSQTLGAVEILANVEKMKCPSFSLPAGTAYFGGSCPGAKAGMTVEPEAVLRGVPSIRKHIVRLTGFPENASTDKWYSMAICQYCYAIKGNYGYFSKQVAQVALMRWTEAAVKDRTFVPTMIRAIEDSPHHANDPRDRRHLEPFGYKRVFRLHDAGDFYSPAYVAAWKEIADHFRIGGRGTPTLFWAPSRLWAAGTGGGREWLSVFAKYDPVTRKEYQINNMVIRPSAFHSNTKAPLPVAGEVAGSTVHTTDQGTEAEWAMLMPNALTPVVHRRAYGVPPPKPRKRRGAVEEEAPPPIPESERRMRAAAEEGAWRSANPEQTPVEWNPRMGSFPPPRGTAIFHYICPASRKEAKKKTCLDVIGPDGKQGCRACWVYQDAVISYHIH